MILPRLIPLLFASALVACDDPSGPEIAGSLGYISHVDDEPTVAASATGGSIQILVRTYGPDSCWRRSGEDVDIDDRTITVRPYDLYIDDAICGPMVTEIQHPVTVEVEQEGLWHIRVLGRRFLPGGGVARDSAFTAVTVSLPPSF